MTGEGDASASQLPAVDTGLHRGILARACSDVGLDATGASLIKHTINAVYRLSSEPVIVRIRKGPDLCAARQTVAVARWLAEHGAPTIQLHEIADQPLEKEGHIVTFWTALPHPSVTWQGTDLGLVLREFHRLTPPPDLSRWDPFPGVRWRLAAAGRAGDLDDADLAWLTDECDRLEQAYREVEPSLAYGLIHGDAHVGNLLHEPGGRTVLADLDGVRIGPLLHDLVPTAVNAIRLGNRLAQDTLAHAYGVDVTTHPAWPVLRSLRELTWTTSVLPDQHHRPEVVASCAHRVRTLRAGDTNARWTSWASAARSQAERASKPHHAVRPPDGGEYRGHATSRPSG